MSLLRSLRLTCYSPRSFSGNFSRTDSTGLCFPLYLTTKLIVDPDSVFVPGAGSWETIIEAGDETTEDGLAGLVAGGGVGVVSGAAVVPSGVEADGGGSAVTLPIENPALWRVMVTLPSGCPMKLGITKAWGGVCSLTSKLIFGAAMSEAFAGGSWASTWPASVSWSFMLAVELSSKPRSAMLIPAARWLLPTT